MIYFDNAATTWPKPDEVSGAIRRSLEIPFGNPGRGSHGAAAEAEQTVYRLRESAAELFNALPEHVVLTSSATHGLNVAIKCAAKRGDLILTSDIEHNSVRRPVLSLVGNGVCDGDVFGSFCGDENAVLRDLSRKIRKGCIVVCNHRSNVTNVTMPVRAIGRICRETDAVFIVDASQSAGHADIDVERDNIDFLCMPGHKGLYGPMGTGLLIFGKRPAARAADYRTLFEGGSGMNSLDEGMPDVLPERFEAGTLNAHGAAGLLAGIEWVKKVGYDVISSYERMLFFAMSGLLRNTDGVTLYGDGTPGPIILFNVRGYSPSAVATALDDRKIAVRSGFHCAPTVHKLLGTENGAVRISFGAFNTLSEVRDAADAIREIAARKNSA